VKSSVELVHREEEAFARGQRLECLAERIVRPRYKHAAQLLQRPFAGTHEQTPPTLTAREDAPGQGWEQTGPKHG
jgi:hypothetical protein